ncbi:MAG: radical SAM family heme chaperone HemW [Proteobacteria bacterium]|nr:radical SAM family heme chaperone HemW [Pseudomonadota bacterium]MBU4296854.1 radical SAM family heme chaperone HemW [Pseudomonadota bacterium]MCG2746365.1 radical SAM family heme chaperone HemW [Desulfobulbaceae bacterium]
MSSSTLNSPAEHHQAGIYLHIPFCKTKCLYCSFNSHAGRDVEIAGYLEALNSHIRRMADHPWCRSHSFFSLYIGGGTPTICDASLLNQLITNCLAAFSFCPEPEITVESNPNTVSSAKLQALRAAGVNRLSIGVQSFSPARLKCLGRSHTAEDAVLALAMARDAGFNNINLDLMYALPGQTADEWQQTLEQAISLAPEHFSLYELMVEEKTPLAALVADGQYQLPTEDEVADMEAVTIGLLASRGYKRYEISNYARLGFTCRHNINYWQNRSWLGLGAGAVGSLSGTKVTNVADPLIYTLRVNSNHDPISEMECLCRQTLFRETMIMGLRMLAGVSIKELEDRFALNPMDYYGATLQTLLAQGLVVLDNGFLRLSCLALPIANRVLAELV